MSYVTSFPQADNLGFVYQVFCEMPEEGLSRYTFADKYAITDRQGAYYLNALCFIGLAEKIGVNTILNERGHIIQMLDEPFRKKVFVLTLLESSFIRETYQLCKGKDRAEQKAIIAIRIEGDFGITEEATQERRARTMASWFKWLESLPFLIEERDNV